MKASWEDWVEWDRLDQPLLALVDGGALWNVGCATMIWQSFEVRGRFLGGEAPGKGRGAAWQLS